MKKSINKIKICEDYLKTISLRVHEVDLSEYFKVLIENELNKKGEGYELKVELLNDLLNKIDDYKNLPEAPNSYSIEAIEAMIEDDKQPQNEIQKDSFFKLIEFVFG